MLIIKRLHCHQTSSIAHSPPSQSSFISMNINNKYWSTRFKSARKKMIFFNHLKRTGTNISRHMHKLKCQAKSWPLLMQILLYTNYVHYYVRTSPFSSVARSKLNIENAAQIMSMYEHLSYSCIDSICSRDSLLTTTDRLKMFAVIMSLYCRKLIKS